MPEHTEQPNSEMSAAQKAVVGSRWAIGGAAIVKVISTIAQVALAWLLAPQDLGLAAAAVAVTSTFGIMQVGGLHVILVTTRRRFVFLGGQAFYVGLLVNCAIAGLLICFSGLAAQKAEVPILQPLIIIAALTLPIAQFGIIQSAMLVRRMKFQTLNEANILYGVIRFSTQLVLAWFGFGAYSVLLPEIPAAIARVLYVRRHCRPIPLVRPVVRDWLVLWQQSFVLNLNGFLAGYKAHAPLLIVGVVFGTAAMGVFNWGMLIATQTSSFLASSLGNVFLSMFSQYKKEAGTGVNEFTRGTSIMTCMLVPVAILQFLLTDELIPMVFEEKWHAAGPVAAIFSIGILATPLTIMAQGMLLADNRYGTQVAVNLFTVVLISLATSVSFLGTSLVETAATVTAVHCVCALLHAAAALRFKAVVIWPMFLRYGQTVFAGVPSFAISWLWLTKDVVPNPFVRMAMLIIINLFGYGMLLRLTAMPVYADVKACMAILVNRIHKRQLASTA